MAILKSWVLVIAVAFALSFMQANAGGVYCGSPYSTCFQKYVECPEQCPTTGAENSMKQVCYMDCDKPLCRAECRRRTPNCNHPGSACHDPRFIGGDGIVFYFHGKSNQHFSLVSDSDLQINGRFIGHRPAGRPRDFTWIQALGILFNSHSFSLEATKSAVWDPQSDHLKFGFNGQDFTLPLETLSTWYSPKKDIKIERVSVKNSVIITLKDKAEIQSALFDKKKKKDKAEIMVNVVPVTKEDDRIHGYKLPSDDCFAHLEVQFRFFDLSGKVDGVLGRTYRPDFKNPAKPGVAMPVVGGEDTFRTTSLLSPDCKSCIYLSSSESTAENGPGTEYGTLDCTRGSSRGYGIVCRK